jgi:hypothetical protein
MNEGAPMNNDDVIVNEDAVKALTALGATE